MIRLSRNLFNQQNVKFIKQNKQVEDILKKNKSTFSKGLLNGRTPSFFQVRNKALDLSTFLIVYKIFLIDHYLFIVMRKYVVP